MRPISQKNKQVIDTDPYYKKCVRRNEGNCQGRITIDHTIIFQGRQLDELWALVPVCAYHHSVDSFQDGGDLDREKHTYYALLKATEDDLRAVSKAIDYIALKKRLIAKYGV